jgi:hypothetical protein
MWLETRRFMNENKIEPQRRDYSDFEAEVMRIIEQMRVALDNRNFEEFNRLNAELWPLNDKWNQDSNDVWEIVEKEFESRRRQLEGQDNEDPYWWIEFEKKKRERIKELQETNYQKRKNFYELLFSRYEKKEYFFTEVEWQRRLIEEFEEVSDREICDNSEDDNGNGEIDCEEAVCGGKVCGWEEIIVEPEPKTEEEIPKEAPVAPIVEEPTEESNETEPAVEETEESNETETNLAGITGQVIAESTEETEENNETEPAEPVIKRVPLYCIANTCQLREEEKERESVCGNHICEEGEKGICKEDCSICPTYPPLECDGKVIFSGEDENGCPLEPVCIEEKGLCEVTEDCEQP